MNSIGQGTLPAGLDAATAIMIALLALGLAASSGLNTFLPLMMLAAAAKFHLFGVQLNDSFAWLGSDLALGVLSVASILEVAGDKVPAVDHALDVVGTFVRPVAGTLAAASVWRTFRARPRGSGLSLISRPRGRSRESW